MLNCKTFFSTYFIIPISQLSCFSFFSAFKSANLQTNEPIRKYFSSIWFKLPENLFPEFLLVPASTVHCSYICMFVNAMSLVLCTLVSSVGGKVWTSNNRWETYSDLKINYLPASLTVFLKVLVTNYDSTMSLEELYLVGKSSLSTVFF